jgi:AcrR family transcriptional regulator
MTTTRGPGGVGAGLTRNDIVAAARSLMNEHGVEWLTMRRLAEHLGVKAGAIYWHFANKDEICVDVVDAIEADLDWSAAAGDTPRERLVAHITCLREHWQRNPSAVALGRRFRPTAAGRFTEAGQQLLVELGLPPEEAGEQWRALIWMVIGFFYVEDGVRHSTHHHPIDGEPGRYHVDVDDRRSVLDTESLFARVVTLALDGLDAAVVRARDGRQP